MMTGLIDSGQRSAAKATIRRLSKTSHPIEMSNPNLIHHQIFIAIFSTLLASLSAAPCVAQEEKQILTLQSFEGVLLTLALDVVTLDPAVVVDELSLKSFQPRFVHDRPDVISFVTEQHPSHIELSIRR